MNITLKNNKTVFLRKLVATDTELLYEYLQQLSDDTKRKFGPHAFGKEAIITFYYPENNHTGYIACDATTGKMIAYAIVKSGYLQHDSFRLQSYGLELSDYTDCTFAPSVADEWQGMGLADFLFDFILKDVTSKGFKRMILWGGVQITNYNAVKFYHKHGFKILGTFEYNGINNDMILMMD